MSLRSRVLYAACGFYHLQLAFWILTTLLWLPDVQITSQRSPNVPLCGHFTLCTLKWRRAKQAHRACTTSIPLGSGRRRGLPLLGALYLCRGLFVPLKNVEHPLWLFRPSKKTAYPPSCLLLKTPAWKAVIMDAHKLQGKGSGSTGEKKAVPQVWSAQIQRQINVRPSWEEEEAIAARKLGWLDMSSGGWWWCASCHMTPNGQFWQSERSYLGTERIMQHSIYPGTTVGMPDTSLCNI